MKISRHDQEQKCETKSKNKTTSSSRPRLQFWSRVVVTNFWVFKKPGTRRLLCGCKYCYTVPRCVDITVLADKSLYCNAKCCLLYCILATTCNGCFKINFKQSAENKNHAAASKSWVSKHVDKTLQANSVRWCKQAWYMVHFRKGYGCVPSSSVRIRCRAAEIRQLIGHGCCDAILHNLVDSLKRS